MSWKKYLNVKEIAEVGASIQFEKDGLVLDLAVEEVCENYVVVTGGIKVFHADYLITAYDLHERKMRNVPTTNLLMHFNKSK